MSDTPRTDSAFQMVPATAEPDEIWRCNSEMVTAEFARQLERELNAANERIKRLKESRDGLLMCATLRNLKEAKP